MTTILPTDVQQLAHVAEVLGANEFADDDTMMLAASHLVRCAVDAVTSLPSRDRVAAQEILDCARAAVGIATYAVREIDGDARRSSR